MCGLSAIFQLRGNAEDKDGNSEDHKAQRARWAAQLEKSAESMRHRGPNAKGIWISPDTTTGLGHVRLSTRDLSSAGDQPMHSGIDTDDIHIAVNGELYYDEKLRTSLGEQYKFKSTSDSEMVIALYRLYGSAFIDQLRGEFAFVIYDGKERKLIIARDRFGVKPLHYGVFDGRLVISTQCKGVVALLDENKPVRWDGQCLAQGGGHYGNRTLFEGIRKFPPGHILVVKQDQTESFDFQPYFKMRYPVNKGVSDTRPATELIEELRTRLLEAVGIRLDSTDVPIGLLLSGGVDSSGLAGMVAHLIRERPGSTVGHNGSLPTCFTIGFLDDDLDESPVAKRTAAHLGLPFERVLVTEKILVEEFDETC